MPLVQLFSHHCSLSVLIMSAWQVLASSLFLMLLKNKKKGLAQQVVAHGCWVRRPYLSVALVVLYVFLTLSVYGLSCAAAPQSLRPAGRTPQTRDQQVDGSLRPGRHDFLWFCLFGGILHAASEMNCRSRWWSRHKRRSS